jgi:hypothetical protein
MQYTDTISLKRGINKDGAFFAQNIRPSSDDGVFAGLSSVNVAVRTASTPTSALSTIRRFVQTGDNNETTSIIWGIDSDGNLYHFIYNGSNCIRVFDASQAQGSANGLMIDSNNQLVFTNSQYVARTYTTTLDGNLAIDANVCNIIDATNFPSAGYAFIKTGFSGEVIQWTGKSSNQLTGVTRGKYYSTATAHSTGETIYYFNETWKDLGSSLTSNLRPSIRWETWNLFGNGYRIDGYSASDGSDWTAAGTSRLSLPIDRTIVAFGQLQTSSTSYILVGANSGSNGYIYTWDGADTTWICERELLNENISCIKDNYIVTDSAIYQYDGSNLKEICKLPDMGMINEATQMDVYGIDICGDYLYFTSNYNGWDRNKAGAWVCDLRTGDLFYILNSNYSTYRGYKANGGIFANSSIVLYGNSYNSGSVDSIVAYPSSRGSTYQFIYKPTNSKTLQLKGLKLNVSTELSKQYNNKNLNFDVIIRGYDFTRPFLQYSNLKSGETPTGASQFIISSGAGLPQVGDKVEIITREASTTVNSTMASRSVSTVTAGTGKYTIDVSEAFPVAIDATTQNNTPMVLSYPLKELGKKKVSVNAGQLNLDGYTLPLLIQPRFKKMMFEIEVRCGDITISPQLNSLEITYEG